MLIPVDDPADPRLAPYRDVRERDLVGRDGLFIAEGRVVIATLVASPAYRALSLLIAANKVAGMTDVLARLDPAVPVFVAGQAVVDAVAGFPPHRGLLAVGRRVDPPAPATLLARVPPAATVLVLCGIGNHDNMGAIFRNAAAFGAAAVLLDALCCDPLYRKAIRVSVGAALAVPWARLAPDTDLPALLTAHGFRAVGLSPAGAVPLARLPAAARTAVLLGAEGPGLPRDTLERTVAVRIPMAPGFDSLNVATASGIVLHHLAAAAAVDGGSAGPGSAVVPGQGAGASAMDREQQISDLAYRRWEAAGRPDGQHHEHWAAAERELDGDDDLAGRAPATDAVDAAKEPDGARAFGGEDG